MLYLTGSSTNIRAVALTTLLLIVIFRFESLPSTIYDSKEIVQFKHQNQLIFSWHVKNSRHNEYLCHV